MFIFYAFAASGVLILLGCGLVFWLKKTHGFWGYFLLGWALQVLLSLPAGIWQSLTGWGFLTIDWKGKILIPLIGCPFNAAGFSIRWILHLFEKEIFDSGGAFYIYILLMVLQATLVALIFAWRYKRCKTMADRVIILLGVLFLINSLVNVSWCWDVG